VGHRVSFLNDAQERWKIPDRAHPKSKDKIVNDFLKLISECFVRMRSLSGENNFSFENKFV
jgi:hypothetical protein